MRGRAKFDIDLYPVMAYNGVYQLIKEIDMTHRDLVSDLIHPDSTLRGMLPRVNWRKLCNEQVALFSGAVLVALHTSGGDDLRLVYERIFDVEIEREIIPF